MPRNVGRGSKESKIKPPIDPTPGVGRFTLEKVQPHLRPELNKRIMAIAEDSADLIGSEREAVIEATLKRFADWITPLPPDPTSTAPPGWWNRVTARFTGRGKHTQILRPRREIPSVLASLPFEERWRQVMLDQGLRFNACLNEMMALNGGAIAVIWQSHWRQENYAYNPAHKERDGKVYALRGNWAVERGLMQAGAAGFYDEVTGVGVEPNCRCFATYVYTLSKLPSEMLTHNGRAELKRVHAEVARMMKDTK